MGTTFVLFEREEDRNDARMEAECTNMVLCSVSHGLPIDWEVVLGEVAGFVVVDLQIIAFRLGFG